jgi:hypothetical protein
MRLPHHHILLPTPPTLAMLATAGTRAHILRHPNKPHQPPAIHTILHRFANVPYLKSAMSLSRRPHPYVPNLRTTESLRVMKDQAESNLLHFTRYAIILTEEIQLMTRRCVSYVLERHKLYGEKGRCYLPPARLCIWSGRDLCSYAMRFSICT